VVRQIAILVQPVMPAASSRLLDSLGVPEDERNFAALGGARRIAPGTVLPAPQAAFPRYIEPTAACEPDPCSSTAIAIWIFRTLPAISTVSLPVPRPQELAAW